MTIDTMKEKWRHHEKRVEVMSIRLSEYTLNQLEELSVFYQVSKSALAADLMLAGLSQLLKEHPR